MIILSSWGVSLYLAILHYHEEGVVLKVIFGKVFCRWVCPMGLIMEITMITNVWHPVQMGVYNTKFNNPDLSS
ncbi:MAG: hypothetical protein A2W90_21620 [Bacteroidetes bacterium GWF2_42_66]|nr:MAG: hypothetical protein A2W89_19240 [Bacteroidetes bacterium GWE2_42_39]OFY45646.1 MAG: hypothetical protein A2W90_21620 [Bacteroidetes bacterium GWF2_42_66]HBL77373.1 hypothetical protein [Prolixibacteraceae bacterium]HCU62531.1 hypothetical protein [Prolixibacteraceae bacterium]